MQEESAIAVQHAAQVVERARNVDVAHVDMPMLMRLLEVATEGDEGQVAGRVRHCQ
jgi:hypothetical protein